MRGKAWFMNSSPFSNRITPAYAGKRVLVSRHADNFQDHPRLCGEKRKLSRLLIFSLGSPPPMRGKARLFRISSALVGITPAYAGKRTHCFCVVSVLWDHPRLCGEKDAKYWTNAICIGSPPPMRGKGHNSKTLETQNRITPAYAGKRLHDSRRK